MVDKQLKFRQIAEVIFPKPSYLETLLESKVENPTPYYKL